jgi:aryl-alcohol dehydrogenase-like predicted oxidoreductase
MRVRSLGPDGPEVPTVGAGDLSLVRSAARAVDAGEVRRALEAALEAGLMLVDVADEDDSERLAGEVVRALRLRDRAIVACRGPVATSVPELLRGVQARVEASLRATRLDAVPLVLLDLHVDWLASSAWPELRAVCARLVREGKVLRWGARLDDGFEPETIEAPPPPPPTAPVPRSAGGLLLVSTLDDALAVAADRPPPPPPAPKGLPRAAALLAETWLAALSVPLSLCERAASGLLAPAAEKRVAILARRPLAGGALAGNLGPGVKLPQSDDRRALDLERIAVTAAKLAPFVKHEPPATRSCEAARAQLDRNPRIEHRECATMGELALRMVIDRGAIALPRLHRRELVAEAILAGSAPPISTPEHIFSILDET